MAIVQAAISVPATATGGPGAQSETSFDSLLGNGQAITDILIALGGEDACRLSALNRSFRAFVGSTLNHQHPSNSDGPEKPRGIFYWGCKERRTRSQVTVPLSDVPAFAPAFHTAPVVPAHAAAAAAENDEDVAAQQDAAADNDEDVVAGAAVPLLLDSETKLRLLADEAGRSRLDVLTVAGLFGGWWGPAAEQDNGAARNLALSTLLECLGADVTDAVRHMTSALNCPEPAKGFWGVLFLGFMAATTSPASQEGAAQLARTMMSIGKPGCMIPESRVPVKGLERDEHASQDDTQRQMDGKDWLLPGPSRYVRYYVHEFLSALVMLLRCKDLRLQGLAESEAIADLHYKIMQVLLLHEAAEDDEANTALQGMPGYEQQNAHLLAAIGLPPGHFLTGEQCRILRRALSPGHGDSTIVIQAFAGCTKTTTLQMLMHAYPHLSILYTAYNVPVVHEAQARSPPNVECKTTHSIAYPKGAELKTRPGWTLGPGLNPKQLMSLMNKTPYYMARTQNGMPGASFNAALVIRSILDVFCTSADDHITQAHMRMEEVRQWLQQGNQPDYVLVAQQMWNSIVSNRWGRNGAGQPFQFTHNTYLKMFVMELVANQRTLLNNKGRPYDVILIDEAQDVNPVTNQMFMSQPITIVLVGDRHQHIYSFNHCEDALAAAAARPGCRTFTLSSSFRLGPAVAEVVNRLLWQLGERTRPMIGAGFKHAAVYVLQPPPASAAAAAPAVPPAANGPAAAAAEAAGAGPPQPRLFEQAQVLSEPPVPTEITPATLNTIPVTYKGLRRQTEILHLAQPPINPSSGRPYPLTLICRYNRTWVEIAAKLVQHEIPAGGSSQGGDVPGGPDDVAGSLGPSAKRQKTSSGSAASSSGEKAGSSVGASAATQQRPRPTLWLTGAKATRDDPTGKVDYLDRIDELAQLRLGLTQRFRQYNSFHEVAEAAQKGSDPDLLGACNMIQEHGPAAARELVRAIYAARARCKSEATYIIGTCHKAKGTEEQYVQLANDFEEIHKFKGVHSAEVLGLVHTLLDEFNLVYVGGSRGILGLICNNDIQELLKRGTYKPFVLTEVSDRPAEEDNLTCHACNTQFDAAAAAATRTAGIEVKVVLANVPTGFVETLAAQGVSMARPQHPTMQQVLQQQVDAGVADPQAAARRRYDQLVAEAQRRPSPVCPGCVQKRSIWGQLVAGVA